MTNTPTAPAFYRWDGEDLIVNILGKPGARHDEIGKVHGAELKVSVRAAADGGKATDHMVRFLAGEFGVPASAVEVAFGRFSVHKQFRIRSPARLPEVFR